MKQILDRVGAWGTAAVVLLPVTLALLASMLALLVLQALAWPLNQLRERCLAYIHMVRDCLSSSPASDDQNEPT